MKLWDSDVRPGHQGEFRVLVAARRTGLGQVRAYLAADLLRRLSERSGLAPTVVDLAPDREDDVRAVCAALNIHPPRHTLAPPVTADQLSGLFADGVREPVFDVGVWPTGVAAGDAAVPGAVVAVDDNAATGEGNGTGVMVTALARYWIDVAGEGDGTGRESERTFRERVEGLEEPLSVRMMLMRHGYGAAFGEGADIGGAAKTLARWRELVARWARSPSGPMSRRYADAVVAAVADDLDTAAALREMDALADDTGEPDGVKFETFAAADLLFGLDLARDIGR